MTDNPSRETRILKVMKKVLTDVAKDTYTQPGLKPPLSDTTIQGIRECLALITAREAELKKELGDTRQYRPRFSDDPRDQVIVKLHHGAGKTRKTQDD